MSMVQIRNVPPELHKALKARASAAGLSLSDYLVRELQTVATRPTMREWADGVRGLPPTEVAQRPAAILRAERNR
jgi:plasmid stability protein